MIRAMLIAVIILTSSAQSPEQRTHLGSALSKMMWPCILLYRLWQTFSPTDIQHRRSFAMLLSLHLTGIQDNDFTIVKWADITSRS